MTVTEKVLLKVTATIIKDFISLNLSTPPVLSLSHISAVTLKTLDLVICEKSAKLLA